MTEFFVIVGGFLNFVGGILLLYLFSKKNGRAVYLGSPKEFDPKKDVTTLTPVSVHAATCMHKWDTIESKTLDMNHEKKYILVLQCTGCGTIDKTVQTTSPAPPPLKPLPAPPCHHDWFTEQCQNLDMPHEKKCVLILKCKNCGALDKTIEVTSPTPAPAWTKDQCKHKWDVDKRVLVDSAYEQMLESIKVKSSNYSSIKKIDPNKALDLDLNEAPSWMFRKTYICTRVCSICGEIDKIITSNFNIDEEINEETETNRRRSQVE
jgi:hypothetical protein